MGDRVYRGNRSVKITGRGLTEEDGKVQTEYGSHVKPDRIPAAERLELELQHLAVTFSQHGSVGFPQYTCCVTLGDTWQLDGGCPALTS